MLAVKMGPSCSSRGAPPSWPGRHLDVLSRQPPRTTTATTNTPVTTRNKISCWCAAASTLLEHKRCATPALSRRGFASKPARDFYHKLDERYLTAQIEKIGKDADEYEPIEYDEEEYEDAQLAEKQRLKSMDEMEGARMEVQFDTRRKIKAVGPWSRYESMRRDGPSEYQDLTHAEAVQVQAAYQRKLMLDRKVMWLKMNQVPNPAKQAKAQIRQEVRERQELEEDGNRLFPPPMATMSVENRADRKMVKLEDESRRMELESRQRMKQREWRLQNAKTIKQSPPTIGGQPLDPILRHVEKRKIRINTMLHAHLEGFLQNNTSQVLHQFLEGAAVTVVDITANSPKGIHDVHYQILQIPPGRTLDWVKERMQTLAPKLRSQLALKLQLGYTPELRFVHSAFPVQSQNRARLYRMASQLRAAKANQTLDSWTRDMNWGKPY